MDQFVLVPASVYNKSLINQSVTKQELPKHQPSQNPTYQIYSLKKEINKKLFSKADSLVDKILSCPRIKLSYSLTLILDGVETRFFLSDFAQKLSTIYIKHNIFHQCKLGRDVELQNTHNVLFRLFVT